MAEISHETEELLFKLYNLKSSESTIIADILKKKSNIGEMIEDAKVSKDQTEQERERLERELNDFTTQKDSFFEAFGGIKNSDFDALQAVGISVEIEHLVSNLNDKAPEYEDSLRKKIEEAKNKIVELFGKISECGSDLEAADEELQRAEADKQALASLVEQSLSGTESDSLSKQYIRSILSNFNYFSDEEITELCKIILFPEDMLLEFDRTYEERKARKDSGEDMVVEQTVIATEEPVDASNDLTRTTFVTKNVIDEPVVTDEPVSTEEPVPTEAPKDKKESIPIPVDTVALYADEETVTDDNEVSFTPEPTKEPKKEDEEDIISLFSSLSDDSSTPIDNSDAPTTVIDLADVKTALQEDEYRSENDAEGFLKELGFQIERFKKEEINKIYDVLKNVDGNLIKNNFELLRSINADSVAYVFENGKMFVADKELSEKINYLRSKSISEKKIKRLFETAGSNSVLRQDFSTIKDRIEALEKNDGNITDENVDYIEFDTALYKDNVELITKTFELDEKELRNFKRILFSPYISGNMKVLKEYLLSIVKQSNGRYALNTLIQTPTSLVEGIDGIVESGLEDLIASNPEVLELNIEELLKRVSYLKDKGVTLYDEESENYIPELIDYNVFANKYNAELPELRSRQETNSRIPALVGNEDFTQILVDALNDYYRTPEVDPEVKLDNSAKAKYEELIASFEEMLSASKIGNLTYKIDDIYVSRNKLERHIKLLINTLVKQGQEIEGIEKEIILTSLLYNLREDEEKLKKVVGTCLGFNKGEEVGGPSL